MTFLFSAFVGSIGLGMVWFASPLAGYLCDRFGCRIICLLVGTLCIAGLVSSSFVQSLTMMYFTYSALYGLGACFICNPCFLAIAKCFTEKLSVATGIVSLGAGVGVLYTGPLLQVLLDSFEWRNTFRIMAATYALVCILVFACVWQEYGSFEVLNKLCYIQIYRANFLPLPDFKP